MKHGLGEHELGAKRFEKLKVYNFLKMYEKEKCTNQRYKFGNTVRKTVVDSYSLEIARLNRLHTDRH